MTDPYRSAEALGKCIAFASEIGLKAKMVAKQWKHEFMPGLQISRGVLLINPERILGYYDVLHELGHLAVLPSIFRRHANGNIDRSIRRHADLYMDNHPFIVDDDGAEDPVLRALLQSGETEAIAWQFAAMTHLTLPIRLMIAGGADAEASVLCQLGANQYFGINGLQAAGMTTVRTYPRMIRWVQP